MSNRWIALARRVLANHRTARTRIAVCTLWVAVASACAPCFAQTATGGAEQTRKPVDFERDVQPILQTHCWSCHDGDHRDGGLQLDDARLAREGGDSGPVIIPGEPARSELILRVTGNSDEDRMPPEGEGRPLNDQEVAVLRQWIEEGAKGPPTGRRTGSSHWSFRPIRDPAVPAVNHDDWVRSGIDAFVMARLEAEGIAPAAEAERSELIRRVYLDVIGLPPTSSQWRRWMANTRPDWYEQLVDHLLQSPHYGERWGRHWLDLARYADSDGYEKDRPRPYAWRWRDWVIQSLNRDMPFDQFSTEQLAGDLLPNATTDQLIATGFYRNTLVNREGGIDPEEDRTKRTVDRTNTFGKIWLGLTVECAQCHSHKYDPIRQREYYRLYAFFNSLDEPDIDLSVQQTGNGKKASAKAQVIRERRELRPTHLLVRGDFLSPADLVERGVPEVLPPLDVADRVPTRLDLANWLFSTTHPLTARVTVNRIWARYFGRGLVSTEADFGTQGSVPSHPDLLDWLANRFREDGWSLKKLHRRILLSSTYRQSSRFRPELAQRDPSNSLLARQRRLRVEAEIVRDLALAASGLLERRVGGPSVHPPQPAGIEKLGYANSIKWPTSNGGDRYRRGLYTFFQRTVPYPMLMAFDMPDSNVSCTRRSRSNTPIQALTLWNDPVFVECAQSLAREVIQATAGDGTQESVWNLRVRELWIRCLQRQPSESELAIIRQAYDRHRRVLEADATLASDLVGADSLEDCAPVEQATWVLLARTVLNLDEFITRP